MLNNSLSLSLALVAPLLLLVAVRARNWVSLSWGVRSAFWAIAATTLAFSACGDGSANTFVLAGLSVPTWSTLGWGIAAAVCLMVTGGLLTFVQRALGLPVGDKAAFDQIAATSLPLRGFVVLTAGFVEELLYRGVGIGIGTFVLNSATAAALISTIAFVAAHFRWRQAHLIQVAAASAILSVLFLLTHDLWACVLAHLVVDAMGFLIVPLVVRAKKGRQGITSSAVAVI